MILVDGDKVYSITRFDKVTKCDICLVIKDDNTPVVTVAKDDLFEEFGCFILKEWHYQTNEG
jgi:hypothetical protein